MTTDSEFDLDRPLRDIEETHDALSREPVAIFDVACHTTPDVGACTISGYLSGEPFVVHGSSKRAHGDRPNSEIAERLAVARALQSLANRASRQANGLIVQADHVREAHRPQAVQERRKQYREWVNRRKNKRTTSLTIADPSPEKIRDYLHTKNWKLVASNDRRKIFEQYSVQVFLPIQMLNDYAELVDALLVKVAMVEQRQKFDILKDMHAMNAPGGSGRNS